MESFKPKNSEREPSADSGNSASPDSTREQTPTSNMLMHLLDAPENTTPGREHAAATLAHKIVSGEVQPSEVSQEIEAIQERL